MITSPNSEYHSYTPTPVQNAPAIDVQHQFSPQPAQRTSFESQSRTTPTNTNVGKLYLCITLITYC